MLCKIQFCTQKGLSILLAHARHHLQSIKNVLRTNQHIFLYYDRNDRIYWGGWIETNTDDTGVFCWHYAIDMHYIYLVSALISALNE